MPESDALMTPEQLYRAALERLRFEQSMGLEFAPRGKFEPATVAYAAPVSTPRPPPAMNEKTDVARAPLAAAAARPSVQAAPVTSGDVAARWASLEARVKACESCALFSGRIQTVFGVGNRNAELVFVGEAPGEDEDKQGEPFVGRAGQLLDKIIAAMKWQRADVFICNTIKCRPPMNRPPLPDEIAACNPFLVEQIELIKPKIIVALGSPAAKTLLKTTTGITALRGRWHSYLNIPVMPTFHPAFLLRAYTEENRRMVWGDLKLVAQKLEEMKQV